MGLTARTAAFVIGIVFLIVGVLGYVPNPIVGPTGLFMTNNLHNLVHIISGIVLLLGVYTSLGSSNALKIIGIVYGIVAICGFVMPDLVAGLIMNNMADRWLHVLLAVVILASGFGLPAMGRAPAAA